MLVYTATKQKFIEDVRANTIADVIENEVARKLNRNSPRSELLAWENSLRFMMSALLDEEIPASAGVAIEYNIPLTNRRVDFILTGKNHQRDDTAVIVELKQWQSVEVTMKDAIVRTQLGGSIRETNHPSYQAWSYAALIEDYNETVRSESIRLVPCAYLHNMKKADAINDPFYEQHTDRAPVFISPDALKLSKFLSRHIKFGDSNHIMYRIEHGVIKPSKNLADALASMMQGNAEFLMIDEQKLVYETALDLANKARAKEKQCLIVKGGPGTGKSVVAINLLVELTNREMMTQYVSRNSAPREVFKKRLTGTRKKTHIDNLFKGSGSYVDAEPDTFHALIVDEAHRLNEKSGMYQNLGESQIKEVIRASRFTVFFIDEAQRVTLKDVGTIAEIKRRASECGAEVQELELASQFRCNGSDGYLAWLDHALQIRTTANTDLNDVDYDFQVFDNPSALRREILGKNRKANKARMVAGYCWPWASKKDKQAMDIVFADLGFEAQWNFDDDGMLWAIADDSVEQVGCIHTCQGLEFDYVGVIIGDDFVIRDGRAVTDASKRAGQDRSVHGYKKLLKEEPDHARAQADQIIKNTYRTLMTRGQKGCYLYATDAETREYFANFISPHQQDSQVPEKEDIAITELTGLDLPVVTREEAGLLEQYVPVYDLSIAAGQFSEMQIAEADYWAELPDYMRVSPDLFISRVVGESMNRRIPNGSWCLFRANPGGTRQGKIVVVQHRSIEDPDHGGSYTVKQYHSEKVEAYGELVNQRIVLRPLTNAFGYKDIVLEEEQEDLVVIGEFLTVL
ncbi:ATP/GTP binding protein [Marinobacterium lacunae]|uniref:ATP/GTP binding protein n=1 Tax=Marinobacterium lacunae TaxID=1232683 RepID=A0A081FTI4_9GAMM|nr:DNA/RNA helicase domain-containing protein [Marinobacterium lacunae]KEA61839.1 ATP/GTP binding protein [Marinobacterium lacunae]